jgi:hypothetical protein
MLDSTTIDLCLSMFEWAAYRRTKAAVKLHTVLDLRGSIPTFIHISDGKLHDVNALDLVDPEASSFYVMDSGYVDFKRLYRFVQSGSLFVTRAKCNFKCRKIQSQQRAVADGCLASTRRPGFSGNYPEIQSV